MAVHVQHRQLPEAQRIYRSLRGAGEWPHAYALNALINSYANSFRCVRVWRWVVQRQLLGGGFAVLDWLPMLVWLAAAFCGKLPCVPELTSLPA